MLASHGGAHHSIVVLLIRSTYARVQRRLSHAQFNKRPHDEKIGLSEGETVG